MERTQPVLRRTRLLKAREVEELTQIDVKTIYSYARRGLIPYVRIQGMLRFPEDAILQWIDERTYRLPPRRTARESEAVSC